MDSKAWVSSRFEAMTSVRWPLPFFGFLPVAKSSGATCLQLLLYIRTHAPPIPIRHHLGDSPLFVSC